jgi:hypothetical protein
VQIKGDTANPVGVSVLVDQSRIRLVSGNELIGEWDLGSIGIQALNDGFALRAEGEDFVLRTENDAAVAESLGLAASTPRMARKVAASHPPEQRREPEPEPEPTSSVLPGIVFALGGVLVLAGGLFLNAAPEPVAQLANGAQEISGGSQFWVAFVVGGALMGVVAFILAMGSRIARVIAILVLSGVIVFFVFAAREASLDANDLMAYGFIAGGIVVGVAVVFGGSLRGGDDSG